MTKFATPGPGRVRIETTEHGTVRVIADGKDISSDVTAIDYHAEAVPGGIEATARLTMWQHQPEAPAEIAVDVDDVAFGGPNPNPSPFVHTAEAAATHALQCVPCLLEHAAGQRDTINPATLIVGGNSTCRDHVQIQPGPVLPDRTPSGIVLPGQNGQVR